MVLLHEQIYTLFGITTKHSAVWKKRRIKILSIFEFNIILHQTKGKFTKFTLHNWDDCTSHGTHPFKRCEFKHFICSWYFVLEYPGKGGCRGNGISGRVLWWNETGKISTFAIKTGRLCRWCPEIWSSRWNDIVAGVYSVK